MFATKNNVLYTINMGHAHAQLLLNPPLIYTCMYCIDTVTYMYIDEYIDT